MDREEAGAGSGVYVKPLFRRPSLRYPCPVGCLVTDIGRKGVPRWYHAPVDPVCGSLSRSMSVAGRKAGEAWREAAGPLSQGRTGGRFLRRAERIAPEDTGGMLCRHHIQLARTMFAKHPGLNFFPRWAPPNHTSCCPAVGDRTGGNSKNHGARAGVTKKRRV